MSSYSKANKVCATCAHWGGNRNSIAGGFQVSPTSSSGRFGSDVRITGDGEEHFTAAFTAPPRGIKFWALQYLPYVELLQPLWLRDEIIESIGKNKYLK